MNMQNMIFIDRITADDNNIELRWPIKIQIIDLGPKTIAFCQDLDIAGIGDSFTRAMVSFERTFVFFFEYYKSLDEERLCGNQIRLKVLFESITKRDEK